MQEFWNSKDLWEKNISQDTATEGGDVVWLDAPGWVLGEMNAGAGFTTLTPVVGGLENPFIFVCLTLLI